jgi:hypothetical protein
MKRRYRRLRTYKGVREARCSLRQQTSAYVSRRQHTSDYVSMSTYKGVGEARLKQHAFGVHVRYQPRE